MYNPTYDTILGLKAKAIVSDKNTIQEPANINTVIMVCNKCNLIKRVSKKSLSRHKCV